MKMRRPVCGLGLGLGAAMLFARSSAADTPEAGDAWVGADLHVGYVTGRYHFEGPYAPGFGKTGIVALDAPISGPFGGVSFVLGVAPGARWALGGQMSFDYLGVSNHGNLGSSVGGGLREALMLAAGYWPEPGLELSASVGLMRAGFFGGQDDVAAADSIGFPEPVLGPAGNLAAVWAPQGFGGTLRLGYARLQGDQSASWSPLDVSVGVIITTP